MYDMLQAKVDPLAGKSICFKKNTKNALFEWQEIDITSLWEDLDDKLLTLGQLLGCSRSRLPCGIKVQTSYWEGRWHQN